jgi:hypothetical protein
MSSFSPLLIIPFFTIAASRAGGDPVRHAATFSPGGKGYSESETPANSEQAAFHNCTGPGAVVPLNAVFGQLTVLRESEITACACDDNRFVTRDDYGSAAPTVSRAHCQACVWRGGGSWSSMSTRSR